MTYFTKRIEKTSKEAMERKHGDDSDDDMHHDMDHDMDHHRMLAGHEGHDKHDYHDDHGFSHEDSDDHGKIKD